MYLLIASLSVPLASVREVREGFTTDAFTQCPEVYSENSCFSIIHGEEFSTLDLVFQTQEEFLHWTVGLRYLLAKRSGTVYLHDTTHATYQFLSILMQLWVYSHFGFKRLFILWNLPSTVKKNCKVLRRQFKSCSPTWLGTEERVSPVYSRSLSNLFETNQKLQNYA